MNAMAAAAENNPSMTLEYDRTILAYPGMTPAYPSTTTNSIVCWPFTKYTQKLIHQ